MSNHKKTTDGIRRRNFVVDLAAVNLKKENQPAEKKEDFDFFSAKDTAQSTRSFQETSPKVLLKEEFGGSSNKAEILIFPEEKNENSKILTEQPIIHTNETVEIKNYFSGEPRRSWRKIYTFGIVGLPLATFIILTTVFARLTITFKPKVEQLFLAATPVGLDISVARVLTAQKIIPAERLEFFKKLTREFETTGRKLVEEKARGKVKIYNTYSSSPQKLVVSTRFITGSGPLYRLAKTIIIPGASVEEGRIVPRFVEADLIADQAGKEYNLEKQVNLRIPGFEGTPKYEAFYATAGNGFTGGFKGEARVMSKDDLKRGQEEATRLIYEELKNEVVHKIPQGFRTLDGLREIQIIKITMPREESRADKFVIEVGARARIFAFREQDSKLLLQELALKDHPTKEVLGGSATVNYQVQTADFEKGKALIALDGGVKAVNKVPEEELASLVRGQKKDSVKEFLGSREELASFKMSLFPPWRTSAPKDVGKIKLIKEGL